MKWIMGLAVLMMSLLVPSMSFAAKQIGVYVSPKLVYGMVSASGMKFSDDYGSEDVGSKTDSIFGGSLAVGYDFAKDFRVPIRAELEYAFFSKADISVTVPSLSGVVKQELNIQTIFVNAYWDIDTGTKFTPYLGLGFGSGTIKDSASGANAYYGALDLGSKTTTNLAWHIGVGLGYDIDKDWTVELGYRFVSLGSVETVKVSDPGNIDNGYGKIDKLYQHQISFGARYTF